MEQSETKRMYWLKLKKSLIYDNIAVKKMRRYPGGDTYVIIYLKLLLKAVTNDGVIYFQGIEESFADELALIIDEDAKAIGNTLSILESLKLIEANQSNGFLLPDAVENSGSETSSAERMRKLRSRRKSENELPEGQKNDVPELPEKSQNSTSKSTTKNQGLDLDASHCDNDVIKSDSDVTKECNDVTIEIENRDRVRDIENKRLENRDREIEKEIESEEETETRSPRSQKTENSFETFIQLYPRPIDPNKVLFVKNAWDKVAAGREELILAALKENCQKNPDWIHDGGKYIPAAENWLLREEFLRDEFVENGQRQTQKEEGWEKFTQGQFGSVVNY